MIKTLKIKNFGKIKELEIDCKDKNVFIVGQNGSGKTTILQAISLALTGKVAKNLTNEMFIGPYDKDFLVVLELDDGTKIGRTAKGAKLQLPSGAIFKKVKDVYEHIGFDPALLFNLSYVRQGEIADLFMSGNGKGVIDKLSSLIIDSKRMSEGNTELNRMLKDIERDIENINMGYKQNLEYMQNIDINQVEANIDKCTKLIRDAVESKKYSLSELNNFYNMHSLFETLSYSIRTTRADAEACKRALDQTEKPEVTVMTLKDKQLQYKNYVMEFSKISDIDNEISRYRVVDQVADDIEFFLTKKWYKINYTEDELNEIKDNEEIMMNCLTSEYFMDRPDAQSFLIRYNNMDHVDAESLLENKLLHDKLVQKLTPFKNEIRFIRSIKANEPDKHSREIIQDHIDDLVKSKLEIIEKYKDTPEEVTEADIVDLNLKWKDYNDSVAQYKKALSVYNNTLKEYNELKDKIKSIPTKETLDEMKNLDKNIAQYEELLREYEDKKNMYNKCALSNETKKKQLKECEENIVSIKHWKEVFGDTPNRLRAVLFNPVVEVLNKEFYELFSFSGLGEIDIDWSKVTITIGEKKFEQLSGAQMVAVGLSMRLALLKVMGEVVPIMLVDEPTTFLDDDRKNDIQKLLSHMSTISQCFVSTHDDNIISANSIVINLNK